MKGCTGLSWSIPSRRKNNSFVKLKAVLPFKVPDRLEASNQQLSKTHQAPGVIFSVITIA